MLVCLLEKSSIIVPEIYYRLKIVYEHGRASQLVEPLKMMIRGDTLQTKVDSTASETIQQIEKNNNFDQSTHDKPLVVIFYNREEQEYADRLKVHLNYLESMNLCKLWSKDEIMGGDLKGKVLSKVFRDLKIAVILVSPVILQSDGLQSSEFLEMLAKAETEDIKIIPVLARPAHVEESFEKFQLVNPKAELSKMTNHEQDEIYKKISKIIKEILEGKSNSETG